MTNEQISKIKFKKLIRKLKDALNDYPKTYSDKIYDAVTIDEGIDEVTRVGIRKGLELAISIIKAEREGE